MIELLECDSRPTFILDLERTQQPYDQRLHTVFSNRSLQRLPHILDAVQLREGVPADEGELGQYSQFKEWATSASTRGHKGDVSTIPFDYQTISWTSSTLRKRWRIVSGSPIGLKDTSAGSLPSPPAGWHAEPQGRIAMPGGPRAQKQSGKLQARIHPKWVDELPTSEHVQFFKATDWSATALGPLQDWSICHRQMTRLLMCDSRAACAFWYRPNPISPHECR